MAHLRFALLAVLCSSNTHFERRSAMSSIVAKTYHYVIGIDTHAKKHVAVLMDSLGVVLQTREVRVTEKQMTQFVDWAVAKTGGSVLFAVEGTSSYGETLTNLLLSRQLPVTEVKPPRTKSRGGNGKTDQIDAELAARSVLRMSVNALILPRSGDTRRALRILIGARRHMVCQRVATKNTLIALLRGMPLGIDARQPLSDTQYREIANWDVPDGDVTAEGLARAEARYLAEQVVALTSSLAANQEKLSQLVGTIAASLLDEPGVGPVTAAQVVCAYSHKGRIRSAAAFANLAGTTPIPASSGNTTHYRLNRYGDRQLNNALHTIVMSRMRSNEPTRQYVEKRTKDGLGTRDIRRSLKRYVARNLFKKLETCNIVA